MAYNLLRDLELSGVRWELTDMPIMDLRTKITAQDVLPESPRNVSAVISDIGRITTSVVPPVAPVQMISIETVRAMASRPLDMATLNRMVGEFKHPLRSTATNVVLPHVGTGDLLIITDIPSAEDDATGNILSGASGELMDKMLAAIGMSRANVSVLPMVFWRTPGGRTPTRQELDLARPFIDKAIELIKPRVILTLGTLPAMEMAGLNIAKSHGEQVGLENGITLVPIYHPNYLILKPAAKRDVWNALQNVQKLLKSAE